MPLKPPWIAYPDRGARRASRTALRPRGCQLGDGDTAPGPTEKKRVDYMKYAHERHARLHAGVRHKT
jgi:hypothetical protein